MSNMVVETGAERTLAHVLRRRAEQMGDKPWIVMDQAQYTFAMMETESNRLASGLAGIGIDRGQTVLLLLPNTIGFIACWCALAKLSAVQVPINTAYRGGILAHQINDSQASIIVVDLQLLAQLDEIAATLVNLKQCVIHGAHGSLDEAKAAAPRLSAQCHFIVYEDLLASDAPPPDRDPRTFDLAAIMYTSGTTGASKGVMISHAQAFEYSSVSALAVALGPDDVYYTPLPLFHVAGQWAVVYGCAIFGATAVVTDSFSVQRFWPDVARHGATTTFMLGAMANFLYRQPASDDDARTPLSKVLMVPVIPEYRDFERRFNCRISTAYGSTEFGGCGSYHVLDVPNVHTCGRVLPERYDLRIVDENDEEVPIGQAGEIVVRPREPWTAMAGYWNRPDATQKAWRNLWLHSGDIGRLDAQGNLYFLDRANDAIRRRGENISSIEVENEVNAHPAVLECAVFPIASADSEQEVAVAIVTKPNAALDAENLIRFLERRMAYFMVPRYVEITEALPKTPTGKIQKHVLRARGLTDATWDREAAGVRVRR